METVTETVTLDWEDKELAAVGRYPSSGFEWRHDVQPVENHPSLSGPWLCVREPGPQWIHRYPVLRQPRVLHEFVDIARIHSHSRRDAILQFSNRRGWLGQRDERGNMVVVEDQAGTRFPAEDVYFWEREAALLAGLVECRDLIPSLAIGQPDAIVRYTSLVREVKADHVALSYGTDPRMGLVALALNQLPGRRHRADILRALVQEAIERKLRSGFSLVFRPERFVFLPGSLLEAMYLLLAVEVTGRRTVSRLCRCGCGETFYPKRRNQVYVEPTHGALFRTRKSRSKPDASKREKR